MVASTIRTSGSPGTIRVLQYADAISGAAPRVDAGIIVVAELPEDLGIAFAVNTARRSIKVAIRGHAAVELSYMGDGALIGEG